MPHQISASNEAFEVVTEHNKALEIIQHGQSNKALQHDHTQTLLGVIRNNNEGMYGHAQCMNEVSASALERQLFAQSLPEQAFSSQKYLVYMCCHTHTS